MDGLTQWLAFTVVALCLAAAIQDLLSREIANGFSVAIVVLFLAMALIGPYSLAAVTAVIGPALLVFAVTACLFWLGLFGGGDVKLVSATSLWITPGHLLAFLLCVLLVGGVLALVFLLRLKVAPKMRGKQGFARHFFTEDQESLNSIPYGLAIAVGVLAMWRIGAMGPSVSAGTG
ncbi:A24 family peptidase [Roseospira navarrensis]|nr:prepilin peptidase [Roseospira navarrensis]